MLKTKTKCSRYGKFQKIRKFLNSLPKRYSGGGKTRYQAPKGFEPMNSSGADPGFSKGGWLIPIGHQKETLSLNCPSADDLSARSVGPTVSKHETYVYFDTRKNAESARLKKSVAVQKIFVESGRHFQRSRCVNQNSEKRRCVQCVQNTEKQSKWRTVRKGVRKTQEFKGAKLRRERNLSFD